MAVDLWLLLLLQFWPKLVMSLIIIVISTASEALCWTWKAATFSGRACAQQLALWMLGTLSSPMLDFTCLADERRGNAAAVCPWVCRLA